MTISNIKLIAGLGNPEPKYSNTKHNIGYRVIDSLVDKHGIWTSNNVFNHNMDGWLYIGYKQLVYMFKPATGMNDSGGPLLKVMTELNIKPANILVVYDDISLPIGTIRVREGGSSGGHNGVKSIIQSLQTEDFTRVKVGIGSPNNGQSIIDYVLGEEPDIEATNKSIQKAVDVIQLILDGVVTHGDTFTI